MLNRLVDSYTLNAELLGGFLHFYTPIAELLDEFLHAECGIIHIEY